MSQACASHGSRLLQQQAQGLRAGLDHRQSGAQAVKPRILSNVLGVLAKGSKYVLNKEFLAQPLHAENGSFLLCNSFFPS